MKIDLSALLGEVGVKLYDTETAREGDRTIFRVYITKDGGASLDDCVRASELLSPIFDVEPPVNGEYTLEVSTPGLERALRTSGHFRASIGELVRVKFDGGEISGMLIGASESAIVVMDGDGTLEIELESIKKARTYVEW